jgi:hypothetical protein
MSGQDISKREPSMKNPLGAAALLAVRDRLNCWYAQHKVARELEALPPTEAERILQDVGLSMSDMPAITKPHAGPAVLLPQRLEAVGLDPLYLKTERSSVYRDLERACMRCTSWRRCARDLARGDAQTGLEHYCANAETIDALLVGRPTADG